MAWDLRPEDVIKKLAKGGTSRDPRQGAVHAAVAQTFFGPKGSYKLVATRHAGGSIARAEGMVESALYGLWQAARSMGRYRQ